jgi:hypothetical protein
MGDAQGSSISLSADGNTLASGAPAANSGIGETFVFTRANSVWTQQGNALVGTGGVGLGFQGLTVALDGFGNTLAVGGDGDDASGTGAAWIFVRINTVSGLIWIQQGPKIVGTGAIGLALQGASVALSKNGNTLLSAGVGDNSFVGAVWVFGRYDGVWVQLEKLVASDASAFALLGVSLALDADGTTAAIGGSDDTSSQGAVWIFV